MSEKAITIRTGLDRLRYTLLFEIILVSASTAVIAGVLERELLDTGYFALILSLIAMVTNYLYNYAYDRFDVSRGRIPTERSLKHRLFHAVGFELILLFATLPLVMGWLELNLIDALLLDVSMMAAVVIYTFIFGLSYDKMFPIEQLQTITTDD